MKKIIISNFIEHFYEWKNKIENQRNPYLTQIFNDIKHVLEDPNASHNNKAATLVNIIQNITFEYIPFLFDYSTAELKMINGDGTLLKDEAISVSLYNDFVGDLANSEYLDSESDTEKVLLSNYTYTINDSDNNIDVIMKILDENSLENISDTFVDAYYHDANTEFDGNIIFMIVSSYILYYVEDEGWGYKEYNESWENIFEVVNNVFENEQPVVDLDFTQYLLGKIDFGNSNDYYELYATIEEYNNSVNGDFHNIESENIEFNNEIINPELLTFILTESINLHACGMNIVSKLYDLNNDEVDEKFAIAYPWNESFDDEINYIWYHTDQIIKTLDKSNELNSIIDIDKINAESNTNENNYKSENLNILLAEFFNQMMFIQESLINKGKYNINEWESIYRNINLKELLERLIFSYASDDNVIIKYFHVQEKIDYSQFKSEE